MSSTTTDLSNIRFLDPNINPLVKYNQAANVDKFWMPPRIIQWQSNASAAAAPAAAAQPYELRAVMRPRAAQDGDIDLELFCSYIAMAAERFCAWLNIVCNFLSSAATAFTVLCIKVISTFKRVISRIF